MNQQLLDQQALVAGYLGQGPRPLSGFSFVNIFAWGDFFDFEFKVIDESLCIFAEAQGEKFLYLPPLGRQLNASTIDKVFEHMTGGRQAKPVNRIENIPENLLSAFRQGSYNQYSRAPEYLYRKEDLIALTGNAYKSQRHDCNHFESHHADRSFKPFDDGDIASCMQLYERWAEERCQRHPDHIYGAMLTENRGVHERLLTSSRQLGLTARVMKVKGTIVGYTFGYALDEETFCVYAEIADLSITGAAAAMFRSFCADEELNRFKKINTMDDFAMPNVARAKQSYHPSQLIASFTISLKEAK